MIFAGEGEPVTPLGKNQHIFLKSSNDNLKSGKVLAGELNMDIIRCISHSTREIIQGKDETLWGTTTDQKVSKPTHFLALLDKSSLSRRKETLLR